MSCYVYDIVDAARMLLMMPSVSWQAKTARRVHIFVICGAEAAWRLLHSRNALLISRFVEQSSLLRMPPEHLHFASGFDEHGAMNLESVVLDGMANNGRGEKLLHRVHDLPTYACAIGEGTLSVDNFAMVAGAVKCQHTCSERVQSRRTRSSEGAQRGTR